MKKLFLTLLVVAAGIVNASAVDALYLHNQNENWGAYPAFSHNGQNQNGEEVYVYTLTNDYIGSGDFYFRIKFESYNDDLGPYDHIDYTMLSATVTDGFYESYTINHNGNNWGSNGAFRIPHSTIQASEYTITVYAKQGEVYYLKVEVAKMPISIASSGFSTLCCGYALDFSNTNIKAYTAEDATGGNANLISIDNPGVSTPLLLAGASGTYNIPVIGISSATDNPSNNAFKAGTGATLASEEGNYKNYILNSGAFYLANDQVVATDKAYLQLAASSGSKANLIFPEGETTAISKVFGNEGESNVYYNLQGMKVANPTKGMYILNGKKYVVK